MCVLLRAAPPNEGNSSTEVPRANSIGLMQNEFITKRLTAKGSDAEAPLKPTKEEGPHWRDAPRPRAKVQKSTNKEDPSQARRQEADRGPLKPTNKEDPWQEAKS